MNVTIEKLIELRENKNLTIADIIKYYNGEGIQASESKIYNMLKQYFLDQEENILKNKRNIPKNKNKYSKKQKKYEEKIKLLDKEYYSVKRNIKTEDIAKLAEQGMIYQEISDYYNGNISTPAISERLKRYYDGLDQAVPKEIKPIDRILNSEIIALSKQNLSHEAICEYFKSKGIIFNVSDISNIIKTHYDKKRKTVPKIQHSIKNNIKTLKLAYLREKGMTFQEISDHFDGKIDSASIRARLKKYYSKQNKKVPKVRRSLTLISDKELVQLREKGLTYGAIHEYCKAKNITITFGEISNILKTYYKNRAKKVPKYLSKLTPKNKIDVDNLKILELRNQGLTYPEISDYYNTKGIKVAISTLKYRIDTMSKKQNQNLVKGILNLVTTKTATAEQIKTIADIYGVNLDETLNSLEER